MLRINYDPTHMHISTDVGVNFVLRAEITLPLTEKADSEATVEAWTVSRSRAIAARIGNCCSFPLHQAKISNVTNYSGDIMERKSVPVYLMNLLLGVLPL